MNMKPLFDLFLKGKFITPSCRTKSAMYLTENVPHASTPSAGLSCQHKKKKKSIKNSTPNSMGLVTKAV